MSQSSLYQPELALQVADRIYRTSIDGLWYIAHKIYPDDRGFFAEIGLMPDLEAVIGQPFQIKQINVANSSVNVTRGLHAENWNKYITVACGTCFCALADVRPTSPTFGKVETFLLGKSINALKGSLFVTKGIGNSLCVTDGPVDYLYCVDALYRERDTSGDRAFSLFDPDLNISWPIDREKMILSNRDKQAITLREKFPEKF